MIMQALQRGLSNAGFQVHSNSAPVLVRLSKNSLTSTYNLKQKIIWPHTEIFYSFAERTFKLMSKIKKDTNLHVKYR